MSRYLPGHNIKGSRNAREALAAAGADFTADTRSMVLMNDHERVIPKHRAIVRTDTGDVIGVAGLRFRPLQHAEVLQPAFETDGVGPETLQILDNGAVARLSWKLANFADPNPKVGQVVRAHAVVQNAHDGSSAAKAGLYIKRLVCTNGMTTSDVLGLTSIRHTHNAHRRLDDFHRAVRRLLSGLDAKRAEFQAMAATPMTRDEFKVFAEGLLAEIGRKDSDKRDREVADLIDLFRYGRGNNGETLWDGFNSVTEYLDHHRSRARNMTDARLFETNVGGAGLNIRNRARRRLLERVRR